MPRLLLFWAKCRRKVRMRRVSNAPFWVFVSQLRLWKECIVFDVQISYYEMDKLWSNSNADNY